MPNETFGRLNVKTAPFYLAFRNLSSIDSNHKKIRVCVFQNKFGQVDEYRDEKHKIVLQKLPLFKSCKCGNSAENRVIFLTRFFKRKIIKKSTIPLLVWTVKYRVQFSHLLIPYCFFVAQMSNTIMRSIWTKY